MTKRRDLKKDIEILRKELRKYGKKYGDKDTYEERDNKHIVIQFSINKKIFRVTLQKSPGSYESVKKMYSRVRKCFESCDVETPSWSKVRVITDFEKHELEEKIFRLLETYESE